jgi:UDP-N-acetylmuramate--alanine ligase
MTYKHIHFTGIKGVGMTALAVMAKEAGMSVTGSDVAEQFITDLTLQEAGIVPSAGFSSGHVNDAQLVITTGAHGGYDNPEVISAKEKGIRVMSLAEATGFFMSGEPFGRTFTGISVAGTHGKTTTTAMIATLLKAAKFDPSYYIGTSTIPSLGQPGHYGSGDYFVVESDEYATEPVHDKRPKFFWQHPKIAVITNIEHDHADIYPDIDATRAVFLAFAQKLPADGVLTAFGDDHQIQRLLKEYTGRKITYGFSPNNDFILQQVHVSGDHTFFHVTAYGTDLGEFWLGVPGEHNCLNALAAIVVGLECGLSLAVVKSGLKTFTGSKRRLELRGILESGAVVYDDYGHHPTEITKSLAALRSMYPKKKLVCIFQPHTYSRTKQLFAEFTRCFSHADSVILLPIYASARESVDYSVSSELLANALQQTHKSVLFLPNPVDVVEYLNEKHYGNDTVLVTMGAGDVYKIIDSLSLLSS